MEIYCICQTWCITSVLFSTKCCSFNNFIIFSSSNTFLINHVLNSSRIKVKIWAFNFGTPHVNLSDFKPEGFDSFTYLRSLINNENRMWVGIRSRIMTANCMYLAHIKLFRSKLMSWNIKLKLCKSLIQPVLTSWFISLDKKHGRHKNTQNIWMEDCNENIWTCKWRRMLKNRSKPGDKVHITRGRYCKIHKISPTKIVWTCLKNAKPADAKTSYSGYNGRNKGNRKTM